MSASYTSQIEKDLEKVQRELKEVGPLKELTCYTEGENRICSTGDGKRVVYFHRPSGSLDVYVGKNGRVYKLTRNFGYELLKQDEIPEAILSALI